MSHDQLEDEARPIVAAMHRTVAELQPPVGRLTATAQSRGRAVRRRRSALAGVAGGAVLAVGALGVAQLGTPSERLPPVATPDETGTEEVATAWWLQSAAQIERRLEQLLPDDLRIDATGVKPADPRTGFLRAKISNATTGAGGMSVQLVSPADSQPLSCPAGLRPPDSCVITDGGAATPQVREWHRTVGELQVLQVDVAVESGGQVQVAAANTLDDAWDRTAEVWGPEPSLSVDDALAIAQSPAWQEGGPPIDD